MKQIVILLLLGISVSCSTKERNKKPDSALAATLENAISLLEEKNEEHFQKIQNEYRKDTSNVELKYLFQKFSNLQQYKKVYKEDLLKEGSKEKYSNYFVNNCFGLLNTKEQEEIRKRLRGILLLNTESITKSDQSDTIVRLELYLESEEFTREIQLVLLKEISVSKPSFDWQYYWEK